MPFDVFQKVLIDAKEHGITNVSLHGSGEATMHPQMPRFVAYAKSLGLHVMTVTNGFYLDKNLSERLIDAGIDLIRVSGIGYDRDTYKHWMKKDAFERVRNNVTQFRELGGNIRLYHLILDPFHVEQEISLYRRNWIDYCGAEGEIWQMHNWSGQYQTIRIAKKKRSCGRPFAPQINVRAGGLDGHHAAVVPCCFVLGRDQDAVLGHLDTQSIAEVLAGDPYETLRRKHSDGVFDSYCEHCDQLFDMPETLVWTNIAGKSYGQSKVLPFDFRSFT